MNNFENIITQPINTPVVMIIFNRYDNAKKVFNQIKKAQPPKLFVIADGPRESKPNEKELCEQTRSIINEVDWPCEVIVNFSETNLGCQQRIVTGLNWVFSQTEEAIILEDDCVPSLSFFYYCEEMLTKYKNDKRIMMISGDNHLFNKTNVLDSYYFTRHVHIWGWATWARAWNSYDLSMSEWPEYRRHNYLSAFFQKKAYLYYWESLFDAYQKKRVASWDGAWVWAVWSEGGLSIAPKKNLIQNIGFSPDATHTTGDSIYAKLKAEELEFPLEHPEFIVENRPFDNTEMKLRIREEKRLPYPICKWASKLKWFLKDNFKK